MATDWQEVTPTNHPHSRHYPDSPATKKPTAEELAAKQDLRERNLAASRALARSQLAASDAAEMQHGQIVQLIAETNRELDAAADRHQQITSPLQAELAEIERRQIASILSREPPDKKLESRRLELLEEIRAATCDLETEVAEHKKRLALLERERITLGKQITGPILRIDLLRYASPALAKRLEQATSARNFAASQLVNVNYRSVRNPEVDFKSEWDTAKVELYAAIAAEAAARIALEDE